MTAGPDRPRPAARVGVATAVAPDLRAGDVVVASEVRDDDGTVPLPGAAPLVAALAAAGLPVRSGPVATSHRCATTGALAVSAELAAGARRLRAASGPVAIVGVIGGEAPAPAARLEAVARQLPAWAALAGPRRVLLAGPRSFCAGVERAIEAVERALERYPHPVYVRRQIVHNAHVVRDLERRGAVFVSELAEVPPGAMVVFSAHGVSRAVRAEAAERSLRVVDATCPLVTKVHQEAARFAAEGRTVLLIGHAGHDETEGTLGHVPGRVRLVESPEQAAEVAVPDPSRVAMLTQTTLATEDAAAVADVLRARFPTIAEPSNDDICYATTNRQQAVRAVADEADVVLAIGSPNSSNSLRLVEVARRSGAPAYLVEDATAIHPSWLAGAGTVGLTAGASAPPYLVDQVLATLRDLGPVDVVDRTVARETLTFATPRGVVD